MPEFCFTSIGRTDRGLVRASNQDAFLNDDARRIWAVADGMGGHDGGEIASARLIQRLGTVSCAGAGQWVDALNDVNQELHLENSSAGSQKRMGTTVALLGVEQNRFFCLWAGDSRIYRLRGNQLERLTRDHRYVEDLLDLGLVNANDIDRHPHRNIVTRAVGADIHIDLGRVEGEVVAGDKFLLVTDGICGLCDDREICGSMLSNTLSHALDELIGHCFARGAPDNMTVVLTIAQSDR